jgi:hypothetical protein
VRPGIAADRSALGTNHTRPKGRHGHIVAVTINVQHCRVATLPARHVEAAHAVLAHVAERQCGPVYRVVADGICLAFLVLCGGSKGGTHLSASRLRYALNDGAAQRYIIPASDCGEPTAVGGVPRPPI